MAWKEGEMRIRRVVSVLAAFASIALLAPSASAAGQVCYDVDVNVNGQQIADESGCVDLP